MSMDDGLEVDLSFDPQVPALLPSPSGTDVHTADGRADTSPTPPTPLLELPWVVRDEEKVPFDPRTGYEASATNPQTWGSYPDAQRAVSEDDRFAGTGVVFTEEDSIAGIDLDDCRDPETGEIHPAAQAIIDGLDSYTEVSPSGTGVHIYVHGFKPGELCKTNKESITPPWGGKFEMYDHGRYFTFTGERVAGTPAEVNWRRPELADLYREYLEPPSANGAAHAQPVSMPSTLTDEQVIEKCRRARNAAKFEALFDRGDVHTYHGGDDSSADLGLLGILQFYTRDHEQLERLWGASALARRSKFSRDDYRRRTINTALARAGEMYTGGKKGELASVHNLRAVDPGELPGPPKKLSGRESLGDVLRHGIEDPEELVEGVLLAGRTTSIYGGPGSGKSFISLWLAVQVIKGGGRVLYLDNEMGKRIVAERVELMGATPEELDASFSYHAFPTLSTAPEEVAAYLHTLDEGYDLVVFDSLANSLASSGLDENSNSDVARWDALFSQAARSRGCACLILDHTPKDDPKTQRGAGRKKDMSDAQWRLFVVKPFNRVSLGEISLILDKDREGYLPKMFNFKIGGGESGLSEDETFICRPRADSFQMPGEDGLTDSKRAMLKVLESFGVEGATPKDWRVRARKSASVINKARKTLLEKDLIESLGDEPRYRVKTPPDTEGAKGAAGVPNQGAKGGLEKGSSVSSCGGSYRYQIRL